MNKITLLSLLVLSTFVSAYDNTISNNQNHDNGRQITIILYIGILIFGICTVLFCFYICLIDTCCKNSCIDYSTNTRTSNEV